MRVPVFVMTCALFGAATVFACDDEEPKRPPVTESGAPAPGSGASGGNPDASSPPTDAGGDASTACTNLENTGSLVDQNSFADDPPVATGGAVLDGTYDLIEARLYRSSGVPGLTGTSYLGSMRITGAGTTNTILERVMSITTSGASAATTSTSRGVMNLPGGTTGTIVLSCPFGAQESIAYSVVGNDLTLTNLTTNESFVYTKQP